MSSGSSGRRTTVPEPSRSMFCLMSRMFLVPLCCVQRDDFGREKRGVVGGVGLMRCLASEAQPCGGGRRGEFGREAG